MHWIVKGGENKMENNICVNVGADGSGEVSFIEYYFPVSNLEYRETEILKVAKVG